MTTATDYELPPDIPRSDHREAAQVLAEAFTGDPVWQELKPRRAKRATSALYWIFRCEIAVAAAIGGHVQATYNSAGTITAAAIAYTRTRPGFPLWTILLRIPAMFLLGFTATVRAARMAFAAEAHQPDGPHLYAYYAGSRDVGGGAALMKRLMRAGTSRHLPVYGEAKSEDMLEILRILRWDIAEPIDIGYGRSLTPATFHPGGEK